MQLKIKMMALLLMLSASPAMAQDYVVHVHGIVCQFCAFGVSKKVADLPFIDASRYDDGVNVEVENQTVTVAVKADARFDQAALYAAIKDGGYEPIETFALSPDGEKQAYQP